MVVRSQDRSASVSNVAPLLIFSVDTRGVVTLVEGSGLPAFGPLGDLGAGELAVGQSIFAGLDQTPQLQIDLQRALAGETLTSRVEVCGTTLDTWFTPVRDPQARITGVVGVSTLVAPSRSASASRSSVTRALLVDDSADARNQMAAILSQSDIGEGEVELRVASNGVEALQTLASFPVDLIVMDLMMPVMDGMTLLRVLRQDGRYKDCTIAVVTDRRSTEAELARLRRQADFLFSKGQNLETDLVLALRRATERDRSRAIA